jgi:predicted dehydrogenase
MNTGGIGIKAGDGLCAKGALAQITSSVIHHGEEQKLIFQGENASVSFPWKIMANAAQPNGFPAEKQNVALIDQINGYYESLPKLSHSLHEGQINNVLAAIENGGAPMISGEDGRNTIELIAAIYKAGTEQRTIELPIKKDDPFYTAKGLKERVPRFYQKKESVDDLNGNITFSK